MSRTVLTKPLQFGIAVGLFFSTSFVSTVFVLANDQDKSNKAAANQRQQNQAAQQQAQRAQQQAQQQAQQRQQQQQQQQMQEQQRQQQAHLQAQQRQLQQQAQKQQAQKLQIQQQQFQEQQRAQRERQQAQQRQSQQQAQQQQVQKQQIQQMQFQEQQKAQRERQQAQQQAQRVQQQAQQMQTQQAQQQQVQKLQIQQQQQDQQKAQKEQQHARERAQRQEQRQQQQAQQKQLQQQQAQQQQNQKQQTQQQQGQKQGQQTGQAQQQVGRGNNPPSNQTNLPNLPNRLNQPGTGGGNNQVVNQGNPGRNQTSSNVRNHELNQHLKQFQPNATAQPGKEHQHVRNKEHVEKLLRDNPQLKDKIQKPDGKVDFAKLHLEHDKSNRIPNVVHKNGDLPLKLDRDHDVHKQLQHHGNIKNLDDLNKRLNHFHDPEFVKQHPELARMDLKHASGHFQNQLTHHHFDHLATSQVGKQLHLQQQFHNYQHGDVARRMNLQAALVNHGGWRNRYTGPLYPGYTQHSFSSWYCGPGHYPKYCWTPRWSPWVDWCWWNTCPVIYDPRPIHCRPIVSYAVSPTWVVYDYPTWQPLAEVSSGTWVDLPQPALVDNTDVRLIAVRFVDSGHSDEDLGARYRIWFENQSRDRISSPFNVMLLASNTPQPAADLPQAGVTVPSMEAGETQVVDIRLPFSANKMNREGNSLTPFAYLHVLIDSHQQLADIDRTNNGAVLARTDILPVDPAAFAPDVSAAAPHALVSIAGEGFGPEPGRVIIDINGTQTEPTIYGWYDLGVQFEVPNAPLGEPTNAEVLIIRGDGAASNPVTLRIAPQNKLEQASLPAPTTTPMP